MHVARLRKRDGRSLSLYSRRPMSKVPTDAPSPFAEPLAGEPHLRWHPLRSEWVTYAAYRQGRTFLPPPEYNPLGVTLDTAHQTELPAGDWDVAVFDNRFPALSMAARSAPELTIETAPAIGKCEVVVFTQDPAASLGVLPLDYIELVMEVWGERTEALGALERIQYVLPFENRGAEVGVTLHHPHGQIYAYPSIPPLPARMHQAEAQHYGEHRSTLMRDLLQREIDSRVRLIYYGPHAAAFVPPCARYPYEVWIAPLEPVESFARVTAAQRADLARALKTVLLKYDALWNRPFPYLMAWYQAPTDGRSHPESHLHAEFYPPYRTRDRLKYLAGTELAAGWFAMDALPEEKAGELQRVQVQVD